MPIHPAAARLALMALLLTSCAGGDQPASHPAPGFVAPPTATTPAPARTPGGSATPPKRPPTPRGKGGPLGTTRLTGGKAVALTFDDGPHPEWTPKVLDQLRAARVKATFCLLGVKVRQNPALVARIVREGHSLCNHSWQHDLKLGSKPEATIRADLERTNREIQRAVPGAEIPYYRQPGGKWTPNIIKVARSLGMTPLHWDVDPQDWTKPGATVIKARVGRQVRPGSIVLLHDGGGNRSGTVVACPYIIGTLKKRFGIVRLK